MNSRDVKLKELQLEKAVEFKERQAKINNKFQGYCIVWGNKNPNGQYFTIKTDFGFLNQVTNLTMFSGNELHLLGKVKVSKDETGLLVEAELDVSNERNLIKAETVSLLQAKGLIQIKTNLDIEKIKDYYGDITSEDGHIKYWPITDIMLVPIPQSSR